ncbi:hypothetical protein ACH5RR_009479 [Cinchona calisaya]|uniref:FHA domain-containing protein n=1 Tax=Cinchona calisaya TaxID=153742 RepID=A0ABD3AEK4_9GENT
MEITTQSLSYAKLFPKPLSCIDSLSPAIFPSRTAVLSHNSINFVGFNCLPRKLKCSSARQLRNLGAIYASAADRSSSTNLAEKWILEPIGDGDTRHIGVKTLMPSAFEIASRVVNVGRVPDKADIVIPVPTVSGLHARIQKTEDTLVITDLDSTNGTFIDERRLRPGVAALAPPGSKITFGDTHLAIFRVLKIQVEEPSTESETEAKVEEEAGSN